MGRAQDPTEYVIRAGRIFPLDASAFGGKSQGVT